MEDARRAGDRGEGLAVTTIQPIRIEARNSWCELYRADCLDLLPIDADAVVTDPPYGISLPCNFAGRGRGNLAACRDWSDVMGDDKPFDPSPWLGFEKVILFGANYYAHLLPPVSGWLVWDKERGDYLDQSTCELAWTNCVKGCRRIRHLWNGMMKASQHGESYHPTEKPVVVMGWAIDRAGVKSGQLVLDPYMGGGSTAIACIRKGINFRGIEIDPSHFKTAVDRIRAEAEAMLL